MCTIVAIRGVRPDLPLVLATNRDEFYARPSTGAVRLLDEPSTVGGRDLLAGGTWMGVTRSGLFVGVTNHRGAPRDGNKKSRGEVVLAALRLGDVDAIARHVAGLDGSAYNPFNLMWGDARSLRVAYARADSRTVELDSVPEGVHVLPNDRLDSPSFIKVKRANELLAPVLHAERSRLLAGVQAMLADRQLPALEDLPDPEPESQLDRELLRQLAALCVRTPSYGTRSSTVVMLQPGRVMEYWVADGPPDLTPFVEVSSLF
jgi:uncharacterized protein with NRDE domain